MTLPFAPLIILAAAGAAYAHTSLNGTIARPNLDIMQHDTASYKLGCESKRELAAIADMETVISARNGATVQKHTGAPPPEFDAISIGEPIFASATFADAGVTFDDCRYKKITLDPHPDLMRPGMSEFGVAQPTVLRVAPLEETSHVILTKVKPLAF